MSRVTIIIMCALLSLVSGRGFAQDVKYPDKNGQCGDDYMPFEGVCIRYAAIKEKGTDKLALEIQKLRQTPSKHLGEMCVTEVSEHKDSIFRLTNGSVVEVLNAGYIGYTGYRAGAILFKDNHRWQMWVADKQIYQIDMLRKPSSCATPALFDIEIAHNDDTFIINNEKFDAQSYCIGWEANDKVTFLDGSAYGACASATLFNVNKKQACKVWCE